NKYCASCFNVASPLQRVTALFGGRHGLMSAYVTTFGPSRPPRFFLYFRVRLQSAPKQAVPADSLTSVAHKPSIRIEQASNSYSFRFSELSQPIRSLPLLAYSL